MSIGVLAVKPKAPPIATLQEWQWHNVVRASSTELSTSLYRTRPHVQPPSSSGIIDVSKAADDSVKKINRINSLSLTAGQVLVAWLDSFRHHEHGTMHEVSCEVLGLSKSRDRVIVLYCIESAYAGARQVAS